MSSLREYSQFLFYLFSFFTLFFCIYLVKALKNVWVKLFSNKIKRKRKNRHEMMLFWVVKYRPKLVQILEQSSSAALKRSKFSIFLFCFAKYKTYRFHVAVRLFSNRSQKTSKSGKTTSDTIARYSRAIFWSCHILMSSAIHHWKDAQARLNLFVK